MKYIIDISSNMRISRLILSLPVRYSLTVALEISAVVLNVESASTKGESYVHRSPIITFSYYIRD